MKKSVLPGGPISIVKKTGNRSFPFIKGKQPITGPWVEFLKLDYKLTNQSPIQKDSISLQFIQLDFRLTNLLPISVRTGNRLFLFIKGNSRLPDPELSSYNWTINWPTHRQLKKIVFPCNSYNLTLYWPIHCQLVKGLVIGRFPLLKGNSRLPDPELKS